MKKFLIFLSVLILALGLTFSIKLVIPTTQKVLAKPLTEIEVFDQINAYRTSNKMIALKRNDKLDKAALSRLTVIKNDQDFSGEKTGLTRENATKNNGYNYKVIGDLYSENVNGDTNLVEGWLADENAKKTLSEKTLRDIGIAVGENGFGYEVVVIMAVGASPVTEKLGTGGYPVVAWGGPELWEAINKRRVELGVGPLSKKDELCTIASIRLNQLLELGKLDGHAGFEPTLNRPDLAWIQQKYNIAEYLIVGYLTPAEAVAGWEHTLGHRGLLAGGEYVWGCVYSQNTFAVAIAAY